jgi:hypothetical protein
MKKILRRLALLVLLVAFVAWLATGANRGWTKTSELSKTMDEVTGIEGITYQKRFAPGLDFLGAALLGAGILTGVSFLFRKHNNQTNNPS